MIRIIRPFSARQILSFLLPLLLFSGSLSAQQVMLHFGQALDPHQMKVAIETVSAWDPAQETKLDLPPMQAKVTSERLSDIQSLCMALHVAQIPFVGYTLLDGPTPHRALVVHGAAGPIIITDFPGPDTAPAEKAAWVEANPEAYQQLQRLNATATD